MSLLSSIQSEKTIVKVPHKEGILKITLNPRQVSDIRLSELASKNEFEKMYKMACKILPSRIDKIVLVKEDGSEIEDPDKPTEAEFLSMLENDMSTLDCIVTEFFQPEQKKVLEDMNKRS